MILLIILCVIAVLGIVITVFAARNAAQMNACIDETIAAISEGHTLTPMEAGAYAEMKAYGVLKFHVKQYNVEDLGNLSVMTVNVGVMQMATIVFSPFDKDLPLMSCDFMYMLPIRKAFVEFYDLVAEKDDTYMSWMDTYEKLRTDYADLEDSSASSGWYDNLITVAIYKAGKPGDDDRIRSLLHDAVTTYLSQSDAYPLLPETDRPEKIDRIKQYSDRLIDEGGVSTSFFKMALGEDLTRDFFDQVFFGTARRR